MLLQLQSSLLLKPLYFLSRAYGNLVFSFRILRPPNLFAARVVGINVEWWQCSMQSLASYSSSCLAQMRRLMASYAR